MIVFNADGKTQKGWYHACQSFQMELGIPINKYVNEIISQHIVTMEYVMTSGRRSRFYSPALVRIEKKLNTGPSFFRGEAPLDFM